MRTVHHLFTSLIVDRRGFIRLGLAASLLGRSTRANAGNYHVAEFGARGTGQDDTAAIQAAIDHAASRRATLHFDGTKTYRVKSLIPRSHTRLSGNYCTLKLTAGAEQPLFFDQQKGGKYFMLDGFKLDGNQRFNYAGNESSGGVWLTGWANITIRNIQATSFFRNVLNIYGSNGVTIEQVEIGHCGMPNAAGYFSYGITIEPTCANVIIRHVFIHDIHGFGVHLNETTGWTVSDLHCANIRFGGAGIALTLTRSRKGGLNRFTFNDVDGGTLECNACDSIQILNGTILRSGKRAITWGDNGTGERNKSIAVRNVNVAASRSNTSVSLNFLENVVFEQCTFDKDFEYMYVYPRVNVLFRNCRFHFTTSVHNQLDADAGPIFYENCAFKDWVSIMKNKRQHAWRLPEAVVLPARKTVRVALGSLKLPQKYRAQVRLDTRDGSGRLEKQVFEFVRSANGRILHRGATGNSVRFTSRFGREEQELTFFNRTGLALRATLSFVAVDTG